MSSLEIEYKTLVNSLPMLIQMRDTKKENEKFPLPEQIKLSRIITCLQPEKITYDGLEKKIYEEYKEDLEKDEKTKGIIPRLNEYDKKISEIDQKENVLRTQNKVYINKFREDNILNNTIKKIEAELISFNKERQDINDMYKEELTLIQPHIEKRINKINELQKQKIPINIVKINPENLKGIKSIGDTTIIDFIFE